MPINFNLLAPQQGVAESFFAGQQAAQAEQERNMMRQLQMQQMAAQQENVLAQREQRMAMAEERRYKMADAARREKFLTDLSSKMAEGGHKLDRPTLTSMLQFGMMNKEDALVKLAGEGLRALDEQEQYQREAPKYGLPVAPTAGAAVPPTLAAPAPAAAPSAAFAAPAARPELLAGTPFAIGAGPAPVAAPVVPATAPAVAPVNALASEGFTREQVQNMLVSPVASIRARGEALAKTLLKEPKQATDLEIMEALGFPRTQAGFAAYQATKRQPAPSTTVVVPPQEKAEQGERGKLLVKQYGAISDAAKLATRTLPALETQANILNQADFSTGFGTDAKAAAAKVLSALGVAEATKYATNAQTFLSATQQAVLQKQLEQKGPQTEADAQRITQTGAQLGNTPDANKFIVSVARAQLKRDIAQRNFYDKWWQEKKTYDGAEDAWYASEGGKSLFDTPELKAYAPAAAGQWRVRR